MVMKRGMSLIEVLVVMATLVLLMGILATTLDPGSLMGRARDAQRKKDIGRIKTAFEEYYNDKDCYPLQATIDNLDCGSTGFETWLNKWPCDPKGTKYRIKVGPEGSNCPNNFVVLTNLEYKSDSAIPAGWYTWKSQSNWLVGGMATTSEVNFGVSSSNISWDKITAPPQCNTPFKQCVKKTVDSEGNEGCTSLERGVRYANAYVTNECLLYPECLVSCCFDGEMCN